MSVYVRLVFKMDKDSDNEKENDQKPHQQQQDGSNSSAGENENIETSQQQRRRRREERRGGWKHGFRSSGGSYYMRYGPSGRIISKRSYPSPAGNRSRSDQTGAASTSNQGTGPSNQQRGGPQRAKPEKKKLTAKQAMKKLKRKIEKVPNQLLCQICWNPIDPNGSKVLLHLPCCGKIVHRDCALTWVDKNKYV